MKKLLTVAAILLMSLTILWGCSGDAERPTGADIYYFMDRDTILEPDAKGVYTLNFIVSGEKRVFKTSDQAIVDGLMPHDFVGLTLDGDTITGFTRMTDMPYMRVAQDYFVQSIDGNKIKLSGPKNYRFLNLVLDVAENIPIYNVSDKSTDSSPNAVVQRNDCFSAIADLDGNLIACFITARSAASN